MSQLPTELSLQLARVRSAELDRRRSVGPDRTPAGVGSRPGRDRVRRRVAAALLRWAAVLDSQVVPALAAAQREGC